MTDVSLYRLTLTPLEKSLPRLMEKIVQGGKRAVVMASSKERVDILNSILWTYSTLTFLPHGCAGDDFAEEQLIWLTNELENPNNAEILVLCDGVGAVDIQGFSRCLDLYDGNDPEALKQASNRVDQYRQKGYQVTFFQQGPSGTWEKSTS